MTLPTAPPMTLIAMLDRLVAFPTVSAESNLNLVGFVEDHLAAHGVASRRVPNADGTKANLWATIGPRVPGGVVLSGHTDVVPVAGQAWTSDPFRLAECDGRLYGRGTADMKGFLAIMLALVPEMVAAPLKRPIHFALSYDEEVGCLGAPSMIAEMAAMIPPPEAVIVGEPSMMQVVTSHKGVLGLSTEVRGHEVHSSRLHLGVSAVMVAARLIGWLEAEMAAAKARARPGTPYDPPYTTFHVGRIEGGTAHNITAGHCRFSTDIRSLPEEGGEGHLARYRAFAESLVPDLRSVHPGAGITIEVRSNTPPCRREALGPAESLARALTGDNAEHVVPFGTEAGQFQDAGFSTVICGPGDIAQAHMADEFITLEQLRAGEAFQRHVLDRLCA